MATQALTTQHSAPPPQVQSPQKDVRALIMSDAFQDQIKKAMPQAMSSDVLLRVAVTTIQKTPKLLECSRDSLMQCVLECAQMGLLPDGILGQAYMVPYAKVATLQIGYRGILELARRSGHVKFVVAEAVYDCDKFNISYAPQRTIEHVPDIDNELRGEKVDGKYLPTGFRGVYALVVYKDDTIDFEYLPLHKVERARTISQTGSKSDGPWLNHFEEMARKTAIRSLGKRLPLSADDLRRIVGDEYRDSGLDIGYSVDPHIGDLVRDDEIEAIMESLGWSESKKAMSRRNFAGNREGQLAYVTSEAAKAGIRVEQVDSKESAKEGDTAKSAAAAPSETTTQASQQQESQPQEKTTTAQEAGTTAEASTSATASTGAKKATAKKVDTGW